MQRAKQYVLFVCSVVLSAWLCAPAFANAVRELSQNELASLAKGGLVKRPMTQRRGSLDLLGGTSYQVINAPREVVWKALLDTRHYPRMMPQVIEAKTVRSLPTERTIFMRQGAGPMEASYYLQVRTYPERGDITFAIDDKQPHDLRAAWGFYTVRPYGDGSKTLLAYGVMADIGTGVLRAMVRDQVHDWMLRVPWTVKRFVEGSGRRLYQSSSVAPATASP